ncbi:hypothetical protein ATANTOWER_005920 [Ataeniobius toweri]|uniref:Uncharacterized protein n=1 Tax=Ataeniobius toweri TaxID=208326 RepID=A0ABU7ADH2_9TELE|nr:hypothetical protein [Ataeniobius toweri]
MSQQHDTTTTCHFVDEATLSLRSNTAGVETSPPSAARRGVRVEADGWLRMPWRRMEMPKTTSMGQSPQNKRYLENKSIDSG